MCCTEEVYDLKFEIINGPNEERSFEMYRAELWLAANQRPSELQLHADLISEHIEVNLEMIQMVEYVRQRAPSGTLECFHCPYTSAEFWIHKSSKPSVELIDQYVQSSFCQDSLAQDDAQLSGEEMCISEVSSPSAGPPLHCYATKATDQRLPSSDLCHYGKSMMDTDSMQVDRQSTFQVQSLAKRIDRDMQFYNDPHTSNLAQKQPPSQKESPLLKSRHLTDVGDVNRCLPGFRTILQCGDSTVFGGNDVPSVLGTPAEANRIKQLYCSSDAFSLSQYPAQSPAYSKINEQTNSATTAVTGGQPQMFNFFYDPEVKTQEHSQEISGRIPATSSDTSAEPPLRICTDQRVLDGEPTRRNNITSDSISSTSSRVKQTNSRTAVATKGQPQVFNFVYDPEVKTREHSQEISGRIPATGTLVEDMSPPLRICTDERVLDREPMCRNNVATSDSISSISSRVKELSQVLKTSDSDNLPTSIDSNTTNHSKTMSKSAATTGNHSNFPSTSGVLEELGTTHRMSAYSSSTSTVPLLSRLRASLLNASTIFDVIGENFSPMAPTSNATGSTMSETTWPSGGAALFSADSPTRRFTEFVTDLPAYATRKQTK